jgi:hypothetical protein
MSFHNCHIFLSQTPSFSLFSRSEASAHEIATCKQNVGQKEDFMHSNFQMDISLPWIDAEFTQHLEHICSFFSATINGRNLLFGHKLHIGTPFRGKRFLTRQIPTSCLPKSGGQKEDFMHSNFQMDISLPWIDAEFT